MLTGNHPIIAEDSACTVGFSSVYTRKHKTEVWVATGAPEKTGVTGEQKPVLASSGDLSYVRLGWATIWLDSHYIMSQ